MKQHCFSWWLYRHLDLQATRPITYSGATESITSLGRSMGLGTSVYCLWSFLSSKPNCGPPWCTVMPPLLPITHAPHTRLSGVEADGFLVVGVYCRLSPSPRQLPQVLSVPCCLFSLASMAAFCMNEAARATLDIWNIVCIILIAELLNDFPDFTL